MHRTYVTIECIIMRRQFHVFLLRWLLNTLGLWVAVSLFGPGLEPETTVRFVGMFLWAGLIFSLINSIIRPIVVIFALPAILLTLGLFTFVVNGFMVYISLKLAPGLDMAFTDSILAGIIMSLVNYIMSSVVEMREDSHDNKIRS